MTCASELARWGVFILDATRLHILVPRSSSRHRDTTRTARVHWVRASAKVPQGWASEPILPSLARAIRCQGPRAAVATIDSALHLKLITLGDVDQVFASLPQRYRVIRKLVDARSESGSETFVRLILRALGCEFQVQVQIPGVGRVDFLVDGWLIVECDSEAHHGTWDDIRRDRRRDQAAAALGLHTFRPIAEDIFWHRNDVVAALRGLLGR